MERIVYFGMKYNINIKKRSVCSISSAEGSSGLIHEATAPVRTRLCACTSAAALVILVELFL